MAVAALQQRQYAAVTAPAFLWWSYCAGQRLAVEGTDAVAECDVVHAVVEDDGEDLVQQHRSFNVRGGEL